MKILILFTLLSTLAACDSPMRTRFQTNADPSSFTDNDVDPVTDTGTTQIDGDGVDPADPNEQITSVPGFSNCTMGMQNYGGPHVGYFGICQSSQNESLFKVKMAESDPIIGTCFVPIHIIGQNSFKLGIAECVHNQADRVYDMTLTKERPEVINGVMVIKAGAAVNGYMQCMNAKVNFIQGFPGGVTVDQQCLASAQGNPDAYAYCVCTKFKGTFSTYYTTVPL